MSDDEEKKEKKKEVKATFESLGLCDWICRGCSEMSLLNPTPIQTNCIPPILQGRDVIGAAQTGSGKTAAFGLPILHTLSDDPYGIYALVLTPTRELAFQIAEQFQALGALMNARTSVIVGGMDMMAQSLELMKLPHIVVATPGRLSDHITSSREITQRFRRVKYVVLDEADRLLDKTFEDDLEAIFDVLPSQRQTLLFSATMTESIQALEHISLNDPFRYDGCNEHSTVDTLQQEYVFIPEKVKECYLVFILKALEEKRSVIVFSSTCRSVQLISNMLSLLEIENVALHAQQTQRNRLIALSKFKSRYVPIMVATDVASRGLDIPTVDLVLNYNVPSVAKDYVHRVGRTARAGRGGRAISMVTEFDVERLLALEETIGKKMDQYKTDEDEVVANLKQVTMAIKSAELSMREAGFGERALERKRKHQPDQATPEKRSMPAGSSGDKKQKKKKKKAIAATG